MADAATEQRAERSAWLRLLLTEGIGRERGRKLLAAFGSPQAIFEASGAACRGVIGASAARLADPPADFARHVDALERWCDAPGRTIVTLGDRDYPPPLLQAADPPLLLFAQGDLRWLSRDAIAIVGSRNPTAQGADNARAFARVLGDAGLVVVSGLASGIDGAAHEGALEGRGATIAVMGTGPDRIYPARHRALAHRIAERGVLLTEYTPGTPPLPTNFPPRNRIIAGLARGTLVVEAALQSGSLVTARMAAECGREVFAIPGSIHSPLARGCHALIRQGAKLVETAEDVLGELGGTPVGRAAQAPDDAPSGDPVLQALGEDPVTIDALSARTGLGADRLSVRLLELELEGHVARLPGGLYQRRHLV